MAKTSLAFTPATELARLIRQRKVSPVEVVDELLERIAALNPKLNAYLTVAEEEARLAARKAEEATRTREDLPP
ncbi:MAG: amidase family protein, partial [Chloroflexota bacterium]|nr:amidase family protein [Chloroflexota bacterium]